LRILLTRPEEDAAGFAARLAGCGVDSLVAPLLEIRVVDGLDLDLTGVRAVLLTSANGARALARATTRRDLPVLAVGPATAAAAREAGFADVLASGGDVDRLAETVETALRPGEGPLVHIAGSVLAGDLAGRLGASGFEVRRVVTYGAETAERLPGAIATALTGGGLDGAAFFSPRSAATFTRLVEAAGLGATLGRLAGYCLSAAVAGRLDRPAWGALFVADSPDGEALARTICAQAGQA